MTTLWKKFGASSLALTVVTACVPLAAQTTTPPPTCTTAPASITAFSAESVLTLTNILTTLTPTAPANILAAITSGAQEIRSRLVYNTTQGTVTNTVFLVAPGSPNPTPLSIDVSQQTLQSSVLQVDKVYISCKPTPSIMFVGTVAGSNGPFGNPSGAPAAISLGYTTDNPPVINNVVELVAGEVVAYSGSGKGTLTFPAVPVTPPTTAGTPTIVVTGASTSQSVQVFFNPYRVDASLSTDPNNLALTYLWSSDKPVTFNPSGGATSTDPSPYISFNSGGGDYTITLTVTNSAGVSSTSKFVLTYVGKT